MERMYDFRIGQSVYTFDDLNGEKVTGEVMDKTRDSVQIKWDGLPDPEWYERYEFDGLFVCGERY